MNTSRVLTYIERYLTRSPVDVFFDEIPKQDWEADWDHIEDGFALLPLLDAQLKKQETGQASRRALQHVEFLVSYLTTWSSRVFSGIAEAKKRSVRFGSPLKLSIGEAITTMDLKMCETSANVRLYLSGHARAKVLHTYIQTFMYARGANSKAAGNHLHGPRFQNHEQQRYLHHRPIDLIFSLVQSSTTQFLTSPSSSSSSSSLCLMKSISNHFAPPLMKVAYSIPHPNYSARLPIDHRYNQRNQRHEGYHEGLHRPRRKISH